MPSRREHPGGTVPVYRAYAISDDDRVESSEIIEAENDTIALDKVREIAQGRVMEVWDRGRMVARISRQS